MRLVMRVQKALFLAFLLLPCMIFGESVEEMLATPIDVPLPSRQNYVVSRTVIELLTRNHYDAHGITPAISSEWFNEYVKSLDSQRLLFRQSDIEEFRSFETVLWDPAAKMANLDFAFRLFGRFLLRLRERAEFASKCIDEPQDYTIKEYVNLDRKDAARPASVAEQQDIWRKIIKNELLQMKLTAEKKAAAPNDAAKAPDAKTAATPAEQTPEEKRANMKKQYARIFKLCAEFDDFAILERYLTALCSLYDPHSSYMAPESKEDFDIDMSLSLQGIGATLTVVDSYTTVVDIVPGGPADKDGRLKKGDRIIAVAQDGKVPVDVVEMPLKKVVSQIRGPKSTKVHLTVLEEGASTSTLITIVRDEVKLTDREAKSSFRKLKVSSGPDANVLVLHLPSFYSDFAARSKGEKNYKSTTTDILKLLNTADKENPLDGIILDLRRNGGGALDEAIKLAGLFLPDGPVVQIRNGNGQIVKRGDTDPVCHYSGPLIVMVDRYSASASEIVAAALQDYGRALVVGDRITHGKGTVQNIFDLNRFLGRMCPPTVNRQGYGALKLTIAKFYRINGGSTQVEGVKPSIVFESLTDCLELGEGRLPHVLPWDEIKPLEYRKYQEVAQLLPILKAASDARVKAAPQFQAYDTEIKLYSDFRKIKEIPLEMAERKAFEKKLEEADKVIRDFRKRTSNKKDSNSDEDDKKDKKDDKKDDKSAAGVASDDVKADESDDIVLDETLNIMADYIRECRK